MLALTKAQGRLNPLELSECTIFTTVEPCPMCSFAIQELSIRRVVFGLRSPIMGGYTKWNILQDEEVNRAFPNTFRHSPEVIPDFLKEEVIKGWTEWNEEKWSRLIAKGVFR
jgi:tRNA(adenine34) deaminase